MYKQNGQIVIVLLLTILVALAVGLTITQRSITDISTSTQTEQASRALSAAQAGVEKALGLGDSLTSNIQNFDLGNQSSADVKVANNLPRQLQALEYPPIGKDTLAQFWLANPDTSQIDPYYTQSSLDVYFGNDAISPPDVIPAIELNLITRDLSGNFSLTKKLIDPDATRRTIDSFTACTTQSPIAINTSSSIDATTADRKFYCKYTLDLTGLGTPIMLRARILLSSTSHRVALMPSSTGAICTTNPSNCSLPPQASIITSTGVAGQSQKVLQAFKTKVIPSFFDYAIFSTGEIIK